MLTKCVFVVPVFIPTIFSEMSLVKIQLLISEMKVWTSQRHRVCFVFYTTLYLLHLFDHFGPGKILSGLLSCQSVSPSIWLLRAKMPQLLQMYFIVRWESGNLDPGTGP